VVAIAEVKEIVPPKLRSHARGHGLDASGHHLPYGTETPGEFD